jgi:L-seryl-tRNA(Ser) seleniumtransferase
LTDEPIIPESVRAGADVVSFSGDKLLGAPQAGIIVGRQALIASLRRTPLARALRADKLVLGALEATLEAHARGTAHDEIPVMRMLSMTYAETERRAQDFLLNFKQSVSADNAAQFYGEVVTDEATIGGGSAPLTRLTTASVSLRHRSLSSQQIVTQLRANRPPIIARIVEDRVLLNLRTVSQTEEAEILAALLALNLTQA